MQNHTNDIYPNDTQFQNDFETVKDYVLRKLGSPIVTIELTNEMILQSFEEAIGQFLYSVHYSVDDLENTYCHIKKNNFHIFHWLKLYTFALCLETLGYTRRKYSTDILHGTVELDGCYLVIEGKSRQKELINDLKHKQ